MSVNKTEDGDGIIEHWTFSKEQVPVDLIFTRQDGHTLSPIATMSQLRISYESISRMKGKPRQLTFTGCTNLPEKLPPYLEAVQPELKTTKVRTQLSEITKLLGNASRLTIGTDRCGNVTVEVDDLRGPSRQTVYTAWQLELKTVLEGMRNR